MQTSPNGIGRSIFLRKIAAVLLLAALAWLFWEKILAQMLGILFGAAVIAFFLTPVCALLERKLSRGWAALLVLASALMLFLAAAAVLLPAFLRQIVLLAEILPGALGRISAALDGLRNWFFRFLPGLKLPQVDLSSLGLSLSAAAKEAASTIGSLAGGIYRCFLMTVLSFFLIRDREEILLRLELLVPLKWRRAAVRSGNLLVRQLRMYLRGQLTIALAVGLLAVLAMWALGLKGSLVLGLTVGACNVIPYFGPFIGGIPAVIAALGIGWQRAMWTVIALFLVQQADGLLISPRVMGGITGFSPAVVLLAIFAGARIGGIGAMLLALPALMAARTVYRVFVQLHEKN